MALNGVGIAAVLAGGAFVITAVKGGSISDTVRGWIESPGTGPIVTTYGSNTPVVSAGATATGSISGVGPSVNRDQGRLIAARYGWSTGAQWDALDKIFTRESGWNNTAENASGAYGIAQALPATKYPVMGRKPISNPAAQIMWGCDYIKERYGDPVTAWAHELSAGWY